MKKEMKKEKINVYGLAMGAVSIMLIWLVIVGILIYGFGVNNQLTRATASVFPYPAAVWGANIVTVGKLESQLMAARKFYENQDFSMIGMRVDFSTDQGMKRLKIKEKNILDKLIESRIIENEANRRGIKITDKDVSDEVKGKMQEYGTEAIVKDDMKRLYGWDISQFEENIVKPDLYRERLAKDIRQNDSFNQDARKKAQEALSDLEKGTDFQEVAKKYSDGESAKNGGDLGWFTQDQMLPEISQVVFLMNKGDRSGIIESDLGFHIVLVEDKSTQDGFDKIKLRQVFIRAKSLPEWLAEKEKSMDIRIPTKGFFWDKSSGSMSFNDKELKDFEENLDRNSPDDISVLF